MKRMTICAAFVLAAAMTNAIAAQEPQEAAAQKEKPVVGVAGKPYVGLKVQLVLSRTQGDKKLSSVPYVLWLTANNNAKSNLRMGNQIPVSTGKDAITYRDVGTNIDAIAFSGPDGSFRINLTVTDSSVYFPDRNNPSTASEVNTGMPAFRSFTSNFEILLRDGQTAQYVSATDQVSGQVLKLEATLTVLK